MAAVAYDNASSTAPAVVGTGTNRTFTFSHTTSAGADRYIVVGLGCGAVGGTDANYSFGGVTYGGVSLGQIVSRVGANASNGGFVQLWGLVAPSTGANDVVVTYTNSTNSGVDVLMAGAITATNVSQSSPLGTPASATGSSTAATVNVSSATDELVLDIVGTGTLVSTVGANQTQRWLQNVNFNSQCGNGAMSTEAGAASVTMSWTVTSDSWAILGVPLKPAGASSVKQLLTMGVGD